MKIEDHPKFAAAQAAARSVLAIAGHVAANIDRAPQFARDATAWLIAGAPLASAETQAKRRAACLACEHWQPVGSGVFHCAKCKCLAAKLSMATAICPIGKWGAE